ncbi:N-acetyl-gamma-glutamyl-phosphate reductase [Candidatus Marinamargulisbacteria bacterium SCGC AG-410-N11]|nr:N-acetyl-gamma-glutamyl-phosphate reductase [Candidatus Marinamargulisbacteria bacterium SCGC AG-410-N11]
MISVGIVGASGYTGLELCRLLLNHSQVNITHVFAHSHVGKTVSDLFPQFGSLLDLEYLSFNPEQPPAVDVLFLAVPHTQSHSYMSTLVANSGQTKIIDLSADFRLFDAELYQHYYNTSHRSESLLSDFVYGIPELFGEQLETTRLCANPGCYATAAILSLYPLVKEGIISGSIICDAKSGVSGAGRGAKLSSLYCEVNNNFGAYGTATHRHTAEIESVTGASVLFSPHLVPMNRGILATSYASYNGDISHGQIIDIYRSYYKGQPFMVIDEKDRSPQTKWVAGTNNCWLSVILVPEKQQLVLFSAIDNVVKGAAGQAIQNFNIMVGLDSDSGLQALPLYL